MEHPSQHPQAKRVQSWIERLEGDATALLDSIDADELTAREKGELAVKLLALKGRYIMIGQQLETSTPQGGYDTFLAMLARKMRGEWGSDGMREILESSTERELEIEA